MKKAQVQLGEVYAAKVSGRVVPVHLVAVSQYGGWDAINLKTKRSVRIKSAAKLRWKCTPFSVHSITL